jgi:hypothetical protein
LLERQAAGLKTRSVTFGYNEADGITLQFDDAVAIAEVE